MHTANFQILKTGLGAWRVLQALHQQKTNKEFVNEDSPVSFHTFPP
jgi:hypothetical protein